MSDKAVEILQKYVEHVPDDEDVISLLERLKFSHFE